MRHDIRGNEEECICVSLLSTTIRIVVVVVVFRFLLLVIVVVVFARALPLIFFELESTPVIALGWQIKNKS